MHGLGTKKRGGAILALLLILALSLSACVHMDRGVTFKGDGSGTYTLTLGFSEQLVSLASDQISQSMDDFGNQVKQEGGSYRHYDDTGYSYWQYTRPFNSVADLNKLLTETPQTGGIGDTGATLTPTTNSDTFHVTGQTGFLTSSFHVTGHMSMQVPTDTSTNTGGVDVSQLLKDARESFAITMPNWVTSHTGGTQNGNTVTYTIHVNEEANIDVSGGGLNTGTLLPLGGGVLLVLLVLIAAIIWLRRRGTARRNGEPQPAFGIAPEAGSMPYPVVPAAPAVSPVVLPEDATIPSPVRSGDADTPTLP